jgi:GNAT superfamily N-acetyltransferase
VQIHISRAQPGDAPTIARLVKELLHEIEAVIGSHLFPFDEAGTETRAATWLGNGSYTVFLAYADDRHEVLGFLALYESFGLYADGAFGTIPELYVRPAFRSQGVGTRLLAEAKGFAASRQWTRLEVTTPPLPQFDRTLAFYERHKFRISGGRKLKMDLAGPPDDSPG